MEELRPKDRHERQLANADKVKIVHFLSTGADLDVTRIAVILARQCDLLVHFQRLWKLRVDDLDRDLNTEAYMRNIYVNKRALYKELFKPTPR